MRGGARQRRSQPVGTLPERQRRPFQAYHRQWPNPTTSASPGCARPVAGERVAAAADHRRATAANPFFPCSTARRQSIRIVLIPSTSLPVQQAENRHSGSQGHPLLQQGTRLPQPPAKQPAEAPPGNHDPMGSSQHAKQRLPRLFQLPVHRSPCAVPGAASWAAERCSSSISNEFCAQSSDPESMRPRRKDRGPARHHSSHRYARPQFVGLDSPWLDASPSTLSRSAAARATPADGEAIRLT